MNERYRKPTIEPVLEDEGNREQIRALADFIARILDSFWYIPGTRIRIGIDPILGLLPGLGDIIGNFIGSLILFLGTQLHIPKIVMARMALNIGINTTIGAIPGLGNLFSIWFKSNERNAQLLRRYTIHPTTRTTPSDWLFVIGLVLLLFLFVAGTFVLLIWGIEKIWHLSA